ncbi:MAG: DUF2066 domain-containing protein [Alphaproteobacteria bacterium]|nr:DUF2066 domain-containing protein [Alphaproteobacteria bacterium]
MVSSTMLGYKSGGGIHPSDGHRFATFAVYAVALVVPASGKWEATVFHRSILFASLVLIAASIGGGSAFAQEIYTVRGVVVDATAESPSAAREQAIAEGRRQALGRLVARLVPSAVVPSVALPTDDELANLSLGFEVEEERTSAVRYVGRMTFAFDPAGVRRFLTARGVGFAETRSLPVLVIPLLDTGAGPLLWEEGNPFRAAWANTIIGLGLVPFVVPYGDIADVRDLTTAQALGGDEDALARMAERYGARDAVIVLARPRSAGAVEISVQRIGPSGTGTTQIETVAPPPVETLSVSDAGEAVRYAPAVRRAVELVEDSWKMSNLVRSGLESRVTVTVPIDSMGRWLAIREGLENTLVVSRFDVVQMTRKEALVDLWVNGDAEQLRVALEQRNLRLVPGAGDYILVQRGQEIPVPTRPEPEAPPVGTSNTTTPAPGSTAPSYVPASGQRS